LKKGWLFPGQASQKVGMGKDFYEQTELGKRYFDIANDILGVNIQNITFNGPDEMLKMTKYTQPAIFIVSTIISALLIQKGYKPDGVAGHSLGEYSALVAAQGIDFRTGLELVKIRAEGMAKAGEDNPGTMAAILGLNMVNITKLVEKISTDQLIVAANHNTENQIVVSGTIKAVQKFTEIAKEHGAKMAIPLSVSGAFHSPLMRPARQELADKLDSIQISNIDIPLYSNFNAKPTMNGSEIKKSLINQLENPVLWFDSINNMSDSGFSLFTEIGPGKILKGLNKKINKDLDTKNIELYEEYISYEI